MSNIGKNRFENNRFLIFSITFGIILVLFVLVGFLYKVVLDEANRGIERFIVLREPRPHQDISKHPAKELLESADGLVDRAYRLRVDKDGYIIPSRVHEKADLSIVFLGGSTTECHYMNEEERFPYIVGRRLEQMTGLRINSYNSGMAGNNSLHSVFLLQGKVIPIRPKVVVFMECINDLAYLMYAGDYWAPHVTRGLVVDKEYNPIKTMIMKYLKSHNPLSSMNPDDEFAAFRKNKPVITAESISAQYRKNVELFVYICRQHNIMPVLMTQFNRFTQNRSGAMKAKPAAFEVAGTSYEEFRTLYNALNDTLRRVATEQKVLLIDLDQLVPKSSELMYDTVHLLPRGSALVSDIIAKKLEPYLSTSSPNPAIKTNQLSE